MSESNAQHLLDEIAKLKAENAELLDVLEQVEIDMTAEDALGGQVPPALLASVRAVLARPKGGAS